MRTSLRSITALAGAAVLAGWALPAVAATPRAAAHAITAPATTTAHRATAHASAAAVAASGAVRAAAPRASAGKLAPQGCTEGGGTAQCDLYAMTGTTSLNGTPVPIWGFSTSGTTGSATAPGPVLVVDQGDTVTITLHNQLADAVSLALPGQASVSRAGGPGDDLTGVATGASRSYTFTAARAGTFLYEAGHTPGGARQVAMGLAGALVVRPADGTAYGSPATSYDDDAVLVLSEVDPALNADPAHFDLRNFHPAYRLINGKPFPAADAIATDQGHTVLLRYVNVGSQMHAMSVLGAAQVEIAQDGHLSAYPTTVTAESIEPGETLDTTVRMPAGPEARFAVYEAAQHLDNAGQNTASPMQLAFGGMLTFLDTNAPPPSTDGVGPVATHIKAAPNPSDGRSDVTITADLSDATTGGGAVSRAEFVVDDAVDTGPGFGVPMSGTFGSVTVAGASGTLPHAAPGGDCTPSPLGVVPAALECLDAGKHQIFVRAQDANGNWGVIGSVIFNLPKTGPQTTNGSVSDDPANGASDVTLSATGDDSNAGGSITAAEYFVDSQGGDGTGTAMALNRSATVVSEDATVPAATVAGLTEGTHHLLVHSKDSLGLWGPVLDVPITVDRTGPTVDAASVGPNPSNGVVSDASNPGYALVSAQITDADAQGGAQSDLVDAEAFLEPRTTTGLPGGSGLQLLAVDGRYDSTTEAVYGLIPLSQLKALADGTHHVYVRGEDAAGNWGALFAVSLIIDRTAPALGALAVTPNPTAGAAALAATAPVTDTSLIASAEFWFGTADPGAGRASALTVSVVNGRVTVTVPLARVASGARTLNVRVKDLAGNWSAKASATVTVQPANLIYRNGFEPADGAWSATTGRASISTVAALPSAAEPGSTRGLQVTLPGGAANRAGYVTDTTPAAETGYHARFRFDPHTLTSGSRAATALTLFEARTAANAQVFAVQYRLYRGSPQLRTALRNSANRTTTGGWVTIAKAAHTVQLDWVAATAGSVKLGVDGTAVQTQNGNTGTLRVETALLGVTAGVTTAPTGSTAGIAWFDSFSSGRTTVP